MVKESKALWRVSKVVSELDTSTDEASRLPFHEFMSNGQLDVGRRKDKRLGG